MQNPFQTNWWQEFSNQHHRKLIIAQYLGVFVLGLFVAWFLFGASAESEPAEVDQTAVKAQLWTCAMHPQIRRDAPGKCPLCGMKLVPVTAPSKGMRTLTITPAARQLMKIETSPVERKYVTTEVRMVGKVEIDERRQRYITAWVSGRLDRLFADYAGIHVKKGDHLVYIYSESLYIAQKELIIALKMAPASDAERDNFNLLASARRKLQLLGLTDEQIKELEQQEEPSPHLTITAPTSGIVLEKLRQEGDRVKVGDRIYTLADLSQVWVKLDAYESDLVWLRYGQHVTFTTEAYPGETFTGRIAFVDPVLNKDTRTVKVRVNVANPDGKLKPEMFVRGVVRSQVASGGRVLDAELDGKWISPMHPEIVKDEPGNCDICGMPLVRAESLGYVTAEKDDKTRPFVIPASAALVTGTRAIVYLEIPTAEAPTFEGRQIVLGPRAGDYYLVRHGLQEGDLVVTNGNFKIDSALQIQAKPTMMTPEGGGGGGHDHGGHGEKKPKGEQPESHDAMKIPAEFQEQLKKLDPAYDNVTNAVELADLEKIRDAFDRFGDALDNVNGKLLTGHPQMLWKEFVMLLGNDVVEGRDIEQLKDADRLYLLLKRHMQRVREKFGMSHGEHDAHQPKRITVATEFQAQLATLWRAYLPMAKALAADDFQKSRESLTQWRTALSAIDESTLEGHAQHVWKRERANLEKVLGDMESSKDLQSLRSAFALLSDEVAALALTMGFGEAGPIYQLHCPMAFRRRGAIWLQQDDQPRNPYYGPSMLECADGAKLISGESKQHSQHDHGEHKHE